MEKIIINSVVELNGTYLQSVIFGIVIKSFEHEIITEWNNNQRSIISERKPMCCLCIKHSNIIIAVSFFRANKNIAQIVKSVEFPNIWNGNFLLHFQTCIAFKSFE